MPHRHAHAPPELEKRGPNGATVSRAERLLELGAVLLLSLTTVATAWSGYQATRWSGEQSTNYAKASSTRIRAQAQATRAGQLRIDDLLFFNGWLNAREAGDEQLQSIYRRRFRPAFEPAFRAWLAQRPFTNPDAAPGPTYVPEYRLPETARTAALSATADQLFEDGTEAKENDDRYILSTVFFAAVLFFAGISLRFEWRPLRIAVLAMAGVMLTVGLVFIATLPVA